ncbi:type II/IV secretion system ATPase subunit [Candidatus Woesearchaeota archaeon]|nr:type II/IV secretion system ATPase subunit [Candidatus Woesearchaeota archaeon]
MPVEYKILRQGNELVIRINYELIPKIPSIESDPDVMALAIDLLARNPQATKIVFYQQRDYEYDYSQVQILLEIAKIYKQLVSPQTIISYSNIASIMPAKLARTYYMDLKRVTAIILKRDPLLAWHELRLMALKERIAIDKELDQSLLKSRKKMLKIVESIIHDLQSTKLFNIAKQFLQKYKPGDRGIYEKIFSPLIKPDFVFTKLMATYPAKGEELSAYSIPSADVVIFKLPDSVQYLYHLTPEEFKLEEDQYELLDLARKILAEHKPSKQTFIDPQRIRTVFYNVGHDLLEELASYKQLRISQKELDKLANILVRYTIGFGLIEVLLSDPKIQDITINSPAGYSPVFIVHEEFGDCKTNIVPSVADFEGWASKLRILSGRPFDEANPVLDTEIVIPNTARARVGVIGPPLNPFGIGYAFRRHRDSPWTLPLFIKNKMLTPLAAGLLSFLVDGARTMLIAGTRSAGKTSLLGALMLEIMRRYRIITIEDTLELPTDKLRSLGYNIQPMKVASAISHSANEVPADVGLRTTLRLGDSCLIVGEVRSTEARALYEAMRVGALANVVAGTIHGDSPYGVYDRVVNDLGVPRTSFKATDIVVVANPVKSADGLHRWRRVTQITEVGKQWKEDPLREHGFKDLMTYNASNDALEPTPELINGDSEIVKSIASRVREWAGNWEAVWNNILLRAKVKQELVNLSKALNNEKVLEADFVVLANDLFHKVIESLREEHGSIDADRAFFVWQQLVKRAIKLKL